MQKITTRLFIAASVAFGIIGIAMVLLSPADTGLTPSIDILRKCLLITVCVILPSFAVSVASKYLNGK